MTQHLWLARWMRQNMAIHELSAEAWAQKAGVAGTTLTRFLRDPVQVGPPSTRTLGKLAAAIGQAFPSPPTRHARMMTVPLLSAAGIIRGDTVDQATVGEVDVPSRFAHCQAMVCDVPSGSMAGIMVGDTLVYDPAGEVKDGALLVVLWPTGKCGPVRMVGNTLREEAPGAAIHTTSNVAVMGVLVHIQRDMPPA